MAFHLSKKPFLFGAFVSMPHKKWAISAIFFVLLATALDRLHVVVLKYLTDALAADSLSFAEIWKWALIYPALFLITGMTWRCSGFTGMRWFTNFRATAYQSLYEYITLHSKEYFNNRFAGALANKIGNAVDGTESVFENILWRFLPLMVGLGWYVLFAWMSNIWLGAIILVWSILFLGMNIWFAKKIQPRSYRLAESISTLKGSIVDSLSNISLVQENAFLLGERAYINRFIKRQQKHGLTEWQVSEWALVANNILIFLFMLVMVSTSIVLLEQGQITIGDVVMVISIIGFLVGQFLFIGMEIKNTTKYYGEAKEGLEEVLQEHHIVNAPHAKQVILSAGALSFEKIDFQYEKENIFHHFSLEIPAGQKVGLVGRSGAGKSTFVSLLLRHFDIQDGTIRIDGHDIYEITLESLRRAIAFVPQDTSLFHRTIMENIRYSNPSATDEAVKKAAQFAQADEFIEKLPHGYQTLVGERGVKLSGGQRQRIAIARAFLKDSPILILDEATSSLDSESEHAVQKSLDHLMQERTVIAIAHRLSTLKKMDRIIVIDNGAIVEDGSPHELMKRSKGVFRTLWDHQVKGFIGDK